MRRASKVDRNHAEIVAALRRVGCTVLSLAPLGNDAPDIVFGKCGVDQLAEIKDGKKTPGDRKLTPGQMAFKAEWRGRPVLTLLSVDDALEAAARLL